MELLILYQRRRRTRYVVWGKLRLFAWSLFGLTVLVCLWWWLTQLGPRSVALVDKEAKKVLGDSELAAMQKQVADLQVAFAAEGAADDVVLLDEALEKNMAVIEKLGPRTNQAELCKLSDLQRDRDSAVAEGVNRRILELDTNAVTSRDAGETTTAEANWTAALQLQQQVNRSSATSALKNFVREGRFG